MSLYILIYVTDTNVILTFIKILSYKILILEQTFFSMYTQNKHTHTYLYGILTHVPQKLGPFTYNDIMGFHPLGYYDPIIYHSYEVNIKRSHSSECLL